MDETEQWTKDKVKYWIAVAATADWALRSTFPRPDGWDEWNTIKEWHGLTWGDCFDGFKTRMPLTNEQRTIWQTVTHQWLRTIDSDKNKRIIWMRACHMSFPKIARQLGLSRQTVIVRYETALGHLVERLNAMTDIEQESG